MYPKGTIVEIPEFKDKKILLPPHGLVKEHPDLFMVNDRGSAITKPGRTDFFTGSYEQQDSDNKFGSSSIDGDTKMDIHSCRRHAIYYRPGDPGYEDKLKQIQHAVAMSKAQQSADAGPPTTVAEAKSPGTASE
jgi:hypothetical protein